LEYDYDLIILDVMLPSKDGFQIAKQLRKYKVNTPIIFLTAKDDLESKEI
jgi:DNA-binding response OmpR family regulator